jgi:serine/threonine protein kinase/tetratricopeptide (TPR) repeat protein
VIELDDCPTENEIVGFLESALSDPERARVEAHCASCERCREALAHATQDTAGSAIGSPDDAAVLLRNEIESVIAGVLDETAATEAAVGKRIGRFEIVAVQGRGQFGVVYRARDTQLGRMVAVKVMQLREPRGRSMVERLFRIEAAAAARLQHPNIVTLHDYGEFEGAPYLILELLDGETLRSRLDRAGPLPALDALAIAIDVARALVEAHAAGVIHRDIKPSNVFLCASGQTKVLDFGLAQLQEAVDSAAAPLTGAPTRAGTPLYMAPELFRGHAAGPGTDVYAAGVMLFEMLVAPSSGGAGAIDERIARTGLAPPLRRLLHQATASDRARRFHDAGALLAALVRVRRRLAGRSRRRLGLAVAAALVAAATAATYRGLSARRPARPAVAVIGFVNLSGRSDAAWLSTALSEMLDTDLASSPAIRVASPEMVSHARADLGLHDADRLELPTLQSLRRYLGIDYVVIGSYLSVGAAAGQQTRLDVQIQDARGLLIDSLSETGRDGELLDVVARIASRLRVKLAGAAITPDEARTLRASMPRATDAVRLYVEGLRRRRSAELIEARDLLTQATAAEPSFPLAHSELSQVLRGLGEETQMRDEARRAFELSASLRTEERWLVEARYREAIGEWPQARALRRNLYELFPDDLEYGLELADALDRHAQKPEALAVLAALRHLPPPQRDDPRLDLYEAVAQQDYARRKVLAISAAEKARALGVRWVLARARVRESAAERELGEIDRSLAAAEEAHAIARAIGDREGLSIAQFNVATARLLRGAPISTAVADYEEATQLERDIGNTGQVASMIGNIVYELLMAGDPARAAVRIDEMDRLAVGTTRVQVRRLRALQWLQQGELERSFAELDDIRRQFFDTGNSRGFELRLLGDVLLAQGQLDPARARLEQFLGLDWPADDSLRLTSVLSLARLELEAGQPERAEADARRIVEVCERIHDDSDLVTARAMLARVLAAEHRFADAKAAAEDALRLADHIEVAPEWIDARIALAQARFGLDPGQLDAALAEARAALDRARERGLVGQAYDAQLAAAEIAAHGRRPAALAQLRALADDAGRHGFGSIARRARAAAGDAP